MTTATARLSTRCAPTGCGATAVRPLAATAGAASAAPAPSGAGATPVAKPTPIGRHHDATSPGPPAGPRDDLAHYQKGGLAVIVSVSLVLLLGLLIVFLIRYTKLRAWQAVICILFGFYVASTPLAQYINAAATAVLHLISGVRF
jgi:hypothetical protein